VTATETRTAPPDVVDAVLAAIQGVKWPDGEPYIHMSEAHLRKVAEAAAVAAIEVAFADLRDRCQRARHELGNLGSASTTQSERFRLANKRDGVTLTISYLDETIRGLR
jgi:hypothetical protein